MKRLGLALVLALFASPLLASADLKVTLVDQPAVIRAGFGYIALFDVANKGPETATGVQLSIDSQIPTGCSACAIVDIPAGETRSLFVTLNAPNTPITFTLTATVTSRQTDPNLADNTVSQTITVSAAPNVRLSFGGPQVTDLGLPFPFVVILTNVSIATAHNVDVTVDFRSDIGVQTLTPGCSNPSPGRLVCHVDSLGPYFATPNASNVTLAMTLVAPAQRGSGSMTFSSHVTESEPDFDPGANDVTVSSALYNTAYVTSTANDGPGSLREAINALPSLCAQNTPCTIAFRIEEASSTPWKTIHITSPLPPVTAPAARIEGATQTGFFGDSNPAGPEIEISGGGTVDGDGLTVATCNAQIANLVVNGFRGNGVSVVDAASGPCGFPPNQLSALFVGADPTGTQARPNGRGITTAVSGGTVISDSLISGNTHSGVFAIGGGLRMQRNRIGVQAHADLPLPNGNAGVYLGPGSAGSDIGAGIFDLGDPVERRGNVIAFNGQMGVAVAAGIDNVSIRNNRIWGNGGIGIDVGLDGPSPSGNVSAPVLTLAHYDPASNQTVIEGDVARPLGFVSSLQLDFFASDAPALSGAGEAQRVIGLSTAAPGGHFQFKAAGDLTGQFITATATRVDYEGFLVVGTNGTEQGFLTRTSEISRPIEVR